MNDLTDALRRQRHDTAPRLSNRCLDRIGASIMAIGIAIFIWSRFQ